MFARYQSLRRVLQILLGLLPFFVVIWLVLPVWQAPGIPSGVDVLGHLARVQYFTDRIAEDFRVPEWFASWYNGTPLHQYYPPLTTYFMAIPGLIFRDIRATYQVAVTALLSVAAVATYFVARRWLTSAFAVMASALYVLNPYTIGTVFGEGNLPRTMVIALLPFALHYTSKVLLSARTSDFLGLTIVTTLMILAHQMQAFMTLLLLLVFAAGFHRRWSFLLLWLLAVLLGVGLASAYLVPAMVKADYAAVPNLTVFPERLQLESADWSMFDPGLKQQGLLFVYVGLPVVVAAVIAAVLTRQIGWRILGVASLMGLALSLGVNNPLYQFLPLHDVLLPKRFLTPTVLFLSLLAGKGVQEVVGRLGRMPQLTSTPAADSAAQASAVRRLLSIAVAATFVMVVYLDFAPYRRLASMSEFTTQRQLIAAANGADAGGRMAVYKVAQSEWALLPILEGFDLVEGYSPETTPHLDTILAIRLAERSGYPEFLARVMRDWNAGSIIVGPELVRLIEPLVSFGYEDVHTDGEGNKVLVHPATGLMRHFTRNAIAIGRGAYPAATLYPWMTFGTSWVLEDYPIEYLRKFDIIFLFDFRMRDRLAAEAIVRDLVSDGRTVMIDMTGMPDASLFGVVPRIVDVPSQPTFELTDDTLESVQVVASEPFSYQGGGWRAVDYSGLDGSLAQATAAENGDPITLLGYRDIPQGRLYFLGMNWISHAFNSGDKEATRFLEVFFNRTGPSRDLQLPIAPIELIEPPADNWSFSYDSPQAQTVLISQTWSPHWKAHVDGDPIRIYNHEYLMMIDLPAGSHLVEFSYGNTPIQSVGWGGTTASLIALGFVLWRFADAKRLVDRALRIFNP